MYVFKILKVLKIMNELSSAASLYRFHFSDMKKRPLFI